MALKHPLLAGDTRLQRAATNSPVLASGERGDAVARLQLALIAAGKSLPVSTAQQSKLPDGIFGGETLSAVRGFQSENALKVDGIVGKNTLEKLDLSLPPATPKTGCCSNGRQGNAERAMSFIGGANFRAAVVGGLGGITLPSSVRFLDAAQQATARGVYGTSLDFTRILLTDATGLGGRPFTAAVEVMPSIHFVVINAGTFAPSRRLLIHELAHAWQSQHSINPKQFMVNSGASQVLADELLSRFGVDASAYYYRPGKSFRGYAAEQIACQVESGVASIVGSLSVPPHVPYPPNDISLSVPRWEVRGPGVVTSC